MYLNDISKRHDINKYSLKTLDLYGIDKKIEVYNVNINSNGILLITLLPDLKEDVNWIKIDYNLLKNKIMNDSEINNLISTMSDVNTPEMKTMKYGILKKENNEYFMASYSLIEYFSIMEYKYPLVVRYGTINIKGETISINDMWNFYKKEMPNERFPLDLRHNPYPYQSPNPFIERNYLSKKYKIKNENAFQFWTLDVWNTMDGYNTRRGIDRFVYIPGKGIVGGSYDFYFARKPKISYDALWDNILNEKVMIAEELK
ncbi:hypothetical protein BAX99_06515 [Elizabethkingia miricola]|nr:hypothetical protein BAX99_06515 [Elizabethkingia miricola]